MTNPRNESDFWFPAKTYGWGWGLPVKWQGWVAMGLFIVVLLAGSRYFRAQDNVPGLLIHLSVTSALFIAIAFYKGERPLKWRWGNK